MDYQAIVVEVRQLIIEDGYRKTSVKHVNVALCKQLDDTVQAGIPLVLFFKNHAITRARYITYLMYVLPRLASDETITRYFYGTLMDLHDDVKAWQCVSLLNDFKRIVGLTYTYRRKSIFRL